MLLLSFGSFVLGCQAILLEGKSDKRHSGQSHLRHQGFSRTPVLFKRMIFLKGDSVGASSIHQICLTNTFIQRKCVKCTQHGFSGAYEGG